MEIEQVEKLKINLLENCEWRPIQSFFLLLSLFREDYIDPARDLID